jgi:hypothetical protein
MIYRLTAIVLGLATLCACAAQTTTLPQNQVLLIKEHKRISLGDVPAKEQPQALAEFLGGLPPGHKRALATFGPAVDAERRERILRTLRNHGVADSEIVVAQGAGEQLDVELYVLTPSQLVPVTAPTGGDHWYSAEAVSPWFGLSTEGNIAAQLKWVQELDSPEALGPPNPLAAVGAVGRYQRGQVRALIEQNIEAGKISD